MAVRRKKPRPAVQGQKVRARGEASGGTLMAALVVLLLLVTGLTTAYAWQTLEPEERAARLSRWKEKMESAKAFLVRAFDDSTETLRVMLQPPVLPVHRMQIACGPRQSEAQVREAILANGADLLRLDLEGARARIEQMPWTRSVSLQRVYPDTLEVRVEEMTPVAVMREPVPAYLDAQGRIITEAPVEALAEYPVVQVAAEAGTTPASRALALADATALIGALEANGIMTPGQISEVLVTSGTLRVMALSGLRLRLPRGQSGEALAATSALWKSEHLESRTGDAVDEVRLHPDGRLTLAARPVPGGLDTQ